MRNRHAFRPTVEGELESRMVLSGGGRASSVIVAGLAGPGPVRTTRQPIATLVNNAYASFVAEYDQARAVYYSSLVPGTNAAFQNYTTTRVNVLAEQLVSSLLVSPSITSRARGQVDTLPSLISRRVNGNAPTSLLSTLKASIPPAGSTASAATTLYSLSQDNAIEASRISLINAVGILKNGDFGNSARKHH